MMKTIISITAYLLSSLVMSGSVLAQANPEGKTLVEANCISCHASDVYTRDNRKVKQYITLQTQVEACNTQLGTGWFPEDVHAVVDYLNQNHYKFKK
jgi:hypothetical protein